MAEKQFTFTKINHKVRGQFGLTMNEYAVIDLIFHLSSNPASAYPGWCYASKETMGKMLGLSKMTIHTILQKVLALGLVEKHKEVNSLLRTTASWYDAAYFHEKEDSKESLPLVRNPYSKQSRNFTPSSKESLHYINNDTNKDTNIHGEPENLKTIETLSSDNIIEPMNTELATLLTEKRVKVSLKRARGSESLIKHEKQYRAINVMEELHLPEQYAARVIAAVDGLPLHVIEKAVQRSKSVEDDEGRVKYFFWNLHHPNGVLSYDR